ncbi:Uma2 family endonuclease [Amycolatopsis alkalitolerans]|uniref:Uma2 family endonuclease n=1 Tax=Amycolatopsis alkalitolerans TaxID=2547244 RepID=UPI001F3D1C4B|nr:Uma2 family endonuclease [Amycolatopsis alkalitolerans]
MPDIEPDYIVPWHPGEWTVEEFFELPEDSGSRVELVDGSLLVSPAPASRHQEILQKLQFGLHDAVIPGTRLLPGVNVRLNSRRVLIPDLVIVTCPDDVVYFSAADVLLAVEVESPSTKMQDRVLKRALYAEANIRYYLLVSTVGPVEATLFELSEGEYREIARSDGGKLTLTRPVATTVDLGV